jgi:hypothetical protein
LADPDAMEAKREEWEAKINDLIQDEAT